MPRRGVGDSSGSDSKVIGVKGHDLSAEPLNQKVLAKLVRVLCAYWAEIAPSVCFIAPKERA